MTTPDARGATPLRCPACSADLKAAEGAVACAGCGRRYPVDQGIIDLRAAGGPVAAAGVAFPQIRELTPEGWMEAVRGFLAGRDDSLPLLDALVAGRHRAWRGFLDLKPDSRLLCLGCDYGALVESLAPHVGQVVVLEPVLARLRFVRQRQAIFNPRDDIVLLAGPAEGRLPFADRAFDGVFMADPAVTGASARALAEARRVLRDEGQIFLIADNRFSLALPAGWWDRWPAAGRHVAGLVRGVGLADTWWRKRSGARSLPGLCRQVAAAGFTEAAAFGLWPARRQFDEIIPLRDGRPLAQPKEFRSWRRRLRRSGFFLPAHCLTAQAGGPRRLSSYERIFAAVAQQLAGDGEAPPLQAWRHIMTRKDKMIVQARRGAEELVIRIPFAPAAEAAEARHAATLARLAQSHPGLAPKPLAEGRLEGIDYRVETALPGLPLKGVLAQRGAAEVLARVSAVLDAMNPAGALRTAALADDVYERLVEARLERLFPLLPDRAMHGRLRAFFRDRLYGASLPFGLVHGDFSGSNIYLAGKQAGIVDWEAADLDDLPILDAIGYLESALRPSHPRRSLAESFHALARWEIPAAEEHFLVGQYKKLGIDPSRHTGLVYLRWLRQIDFLVPYWLSYDPRGQERYIHQVIHTLLQE